MTQEEFNSLKIGDSVIFTDKDRGTNTLWGAKVYNKVLTVSSKCYDFITAEENSDYIFHYAWISLYDNTVVNAFNSIMCPECNVPMEYMCFAYKCPKCWKAM